jgi:diguanylate cyclase (GGDEF)-like protein
VGHIASACHIPSKSAPIGSSAIGTNARDGSSVADGALCAALEIIDALRARESKLEQQVAHLELALLRAREFAYRDELTGLPNRRSLFDRFEQAIARGARMRAQMAMLLLDLDGFKKINDVFGHAMGDSVLQHVAMRFLQCLGASDTACRLGGDEFLGLLPEIESERSAAVAADKIRTQLAEPFIVKGTVMRVTVSIGIAIYPIDGEGYGELMQRADQAMYRDKASKVIPSSNLCSIASIDIHAEPAALLR